MKKFSYYIRVSTQKQGRSMLGLESQQKICRDFIRNNGGECLREFMDVESGTHRDRKGLTDALAFCRKNDCALVFAKLDRLARDVEFCFKVVNTGIEIHFVDMPQMNTLLLGVFAAVAQYERELTSDRTKKALAVKKAQGAQLGASNSIYRMNYKLKSDEEKKEISMKKGMAKNERFLSSKDVIAFLKVLKRQFPVPCESEDPSEWNWKQIGTKGDNCRALIGIMKDYHSMDDSGTLFKRWHFNDWNEDNYQLNICTLIYRIKRALNTSKNHKQ